MNETDPAVRPNRPCAAVASVWRSALYFEAQPVRSTQLARPNKDPSMHRENREIDYTLPFKPMRGYFIPSGYPRRK